jgi:hypothetical protein
MILYETCVDDDVNIINMIQLIIFYRSRTHKCVTDDEVPNNQTTTTKHRKKILNKSNSLSNAHVK